MRARLQRAEERRANCRAVKTGRREFVEQDVAVLQSHQPRLPFRRNRAFLGEQRPGAELECDLTKLRIVDPMLPFLQIPDAAGHDDRHLVRDVALAHRLAQRLRSEEHTSELQSIMRISYAAFCLKKKNKTY